MSTTTRASPLKVGLMVPANNTTMEVELAAWLPAGSTVTTVKIPRGPGLLTKETLPAYRDSAIALARQHFANGGLDLIAYGCTAAGFISGPAGDAELSAMLTEATGLPVVTTARAMVQRAAARRGQAHRRRHALPRRGERAARRRSSPTAASAWSASPRSGRRMSSRSGASPPTGARAGARDHGAGLRRAVHRLLAAADARDPRRPAGGVRTPGLVLDLRDRVGCRRGCRLPPDTGRGIALHIQRTRRGRLPNASSTGGEPCEACCIGSSAPLLLCALAAQAQAQTFPDRPIRLIVPYGTGGITDITARILAPQLGEELGQQVVVDNRPGGAGMIGFGMAARAPADGHTLVLATTALAANPILFKDIPYDARKDFAPISLVGVVPMVLVVPPSSPATTVAELIALARSKPGELNYGSAGNGTDNHLTAELFNHLCRHQGDARSLSRRRTGDDRSHRRTRLLTCSPRCRRRCRSSAKGDCARWRRPARAAARRCRTCRRWPRRRCRTSRSMPGWGCSGPPAFRRRSSTGSAPRPTRRCGIPRRRSGCARIGLEIKGGTPQDMAAHLERELNRWAELARHVRFEVAN